MQAKKLRSILKSLVITATVLLAIFTFQQVLAAAPDLTTSLDAAGQAGFGQTVADANKGVGPIIASIISIVLGFTGTIAFIIFLMGGFMWLTARGNEEQVKNARKYMVNATIGIIVIILAYSVTFYVSEVVFQAAGGR